MVEIQGSAFQVPLFMMILLGLTLPSALAQSGDCSSIGDFGTEDGESTYCTGQTVSLQVEVDVGNGARVFLYEWLRDGMPIASTRTPSFRINSLDAEDAGSWTVEVTVLCLDFSTDELRAGPIELQVRPSPEATIVADPGLVLNCEQRSTRLRAANAPSNAQFDWSGPSFSGEGREVTVNRGGTYLLEVTAAGCSSEDFIEIIDNQAFEPTADAGDDVLLQRCGQDVVLDASASTNGGRGNLRYAWSGPGFTAEGGNPEVRVEDAQPGTYLLTVTNTLSRCTASDEVVLDGQNLTLPTADAGDPQTLTCRDETVLLGGEGSSSGTDIRYAWQAREGGRIVEGENARQAVVDRPGRYELTVRNAATLCSQSDEVLVDENRVAPEVTIEPGQDPFFCTGRSTTLQAVGDADTWTWSTGATGTRLEVSAADLYTLEGQREDNGCIGTAEVMVSERPTPELEVGDGSVTAPAGQETSLDLTADPPNARVVWEVRGTSNLDEGASQFERSGQGPPVGTFFPASERALARVNYLAWAVLNGCSSDSSELELLVRDESASLFIPEVFTPNGDGVNDEWIILLPDDQRPEDYTLTVYDRRGRLIFTQNAITPAWDGADVPEGVYYYTLERKSDNELIRGAVALIGQQ